MDQQGNIIQKVLLLFSILTAGVCAGGEELFDNSRLHEIRFYSDFPNLEDTLTQNYQNAYEVIWGQSPKQISVITEAVVHVVIDDQRIDSVGLRQKGNNSYASSAKKSLKLDFNEFVQDGSYDGLKKVNLHNSSTDPTFMRENRSLQLMNEMGIKAPRTSFAKVYFNDEYRGLYRLVEQIDNTFLDRHFGNHEGNLYKRHDYPETADGIVKKNHKKLDDWSDYESFKALLNESSDETFKSNIQHYFEVFEYLQILAVDKAVNNTDFYGSGTSGGRNYYLYRDSTLGGSEQSKFHWLPWDYGWVMNNSEDKIILNPEEQPVLIKRLMNIPEYNQYYIQQFCEVKKLFSGEYLDSIISADSALIHSAVAEDPQSKFGIEAFLQSISETWTNKVGLREFISNRYDYITQKLNNLGINCDDIVVIEASPQSNPVLHRVAINKTESQIHIKTATPIQKVSLYNPMGRKVGVTVSGAGKTELQWNTPHQGAGVYIVKVTTERAAFSQMILLQ